MPLAATQMDTEIVILSEVRERQISYNITYMWNLKIKKNGTNELICKSETDSQMQKTSFRLPKGKGTGGMNWEFGPDIYTLLYIKQRTDKDLLYGTRNSTQDSVVTYREKNMKKSRYIYMYN